MMAMRAANKDVFVAAGDVVQVNAIDLAKVIQQALESPRKRARLCIHPAPTEPVHEMLICLAEGTYVRPHRHTGKSESFHIIEGDLRVVLFHDDGRVKDIIPMGPYHTAKTFYYRLMEPVFHTVIVTSPFVLFHETTNGPFDPADTEFAAWAPEEKSPKADDFMTKLQSTNHSS